MTGLHHLEPKVKRYDWGSRSVLAEFQGRPQPSDEPEAELWFGDHHRGEACVITDGTRVPLSTILQAVTPSATTTGASTAGRLPYLLKVLAVERPLSLQLHPNALQAHDGHQRENDLRIPVDSPRRSYPDSNPKPELVYVLATFRAFIGLRDPVATVALLRALGVGRLGWLQAELGHAPTSLRSLVRALLTWPGADLPSLNREIQDAALRLPADSPWSEPARGTAMLAAAHPKDPAVAVSLLLNHVCLQPGDAAFVPPGHLHAYLGGTVIELMAPSDNVLRLGLTSKKVDIDEATRILEPTPLQPRLQARGHGPSSPSLQVWAPPDVDFSLMSATANGSAVDLPLFPPSIVLATADCRFTQSDGQARELPRGRAGLWDGELASLRLTHGTCAAAMSAPRIHTASPGADPAAVAAIRGSGMSPSSS